MAEKNLIYRIYIVSRGRMLFGGEWRMRKIALWHFTSRCSRRLPGEVIRLLEHDKATGEDNVIEKVPAN